MPQPKVVDAFGNGVPHPHEFVHETVKKFSVIRLSCTCGYDGLAILDKDGNVICPNEEALRNQHLATLNQAADSGTESQEAVNQLVEEAVAKQMQPMKDLIAQLTQQLAAKAESQVKTGGKD